MVGRISNSCYYLKKIVLLLSVNIVIDVTYLIYVIYTRLCLQCFDAVDWASGRASGL